MSTCDTQDARVTRDRAFAPWAPDRLPDPADLPKARWREALRLLAAPVTRLHHYRNLRGVLIRAAMEDLEKDRSP